MSKGSSAARAEDLWILTKALGISHLEAVRRMNGDRGDDEQRGSSATVKAVRDRARARQAATGESYKAALAAVLQQPGYRATEASFPIVHPVDVDWSLLYGVQVALKRTAGGVSQLLAGVVLAPVAGPRNKPRLRIALTQTAFGKAVGEVHSVEIRRWHVDPTPVEVAAAVSRRTRCLAGRPVYSPQDVPTDVLATEPTLRRRRLKPALLQAPIATQRTDRGRSTPLYAIADAEPIPASSERHAEAIRRRRRCAECGATASEPLQRAADEEHYCDHHIDLAEQRVVDAEIARSRVVSVSWAREVLQDERTVLAVLRRNATDDLFSIRVEDVEGVVLLDQRMPVSRMLGPFDLLVRDTASKSDIPDWVLEPSASEFMGRRVIGAATPEATHAYAGMLYAAGLREQPYWSIHIDDDLHYYYRKWKRDADSPKPRGRSALALSARRLARATTSTDLLGTPAEVVETMRTKLYEMARTEVAPDQLAHAERFRKSRGRTLRTGRAGMLAERRVRMSKDLLKLFGHGDTQT